jgi:hypothetical protein
MMTNPVPHPTPIELTYAPESGALSLLDHAVHSAAFALLAANPKIRDEYVKSRVSIRWGTSHTPLDAHASSSFPRRKSWREAIGASSG